MLFAGKNLLCLYKEAELRLNCFLTNLIKPMKNVHVCYYLLSHSRIKVSTDDLAKVNWIKFKIWEFYCEKLTVLLIFIHSTEGAQPCR